MTTITKKQVKLNEIAEAKESLLAMINPKDVVYTLVHKVSSSGMNRTISVYIVQEGKIVNINWYLEKLDLFKRDNNGYLKVSGCGMDMGFHVVYNLGAALWPNGTRNGVADSAGGYALKQQWL